MEVLIFTFIVAIIGSNIADSQAQHLSSLKEDDLLRSIVRRQISKLIDGISDEYFALITYEEFGKYLTDVIVTDLPNEVRRAVVQQFAQTGVVSEASDKLILDHILVWSLQFAPEYLQAEIAPVLEEYHVTGRISEGHEKLVGDILFYLLGAEETDGKSKRGFGAKLWSFVKKVLRFVVYLIDNRH